MRGRSRRPKAGTDAGSWMWIEELATGPRVLHHFPQLHANQPTAVIQSKQGERDHDSARLGGFRSREVRQELVA